MKKILLLLSVLIASPALAADTGIVIDLKGPTKDVSSLVADLKKEAAYQDAGCAAANKSGKKIQCARADGALLTFLSKNAPPKVIWHISAAPATSVGGSCPPSPCSMMHCPPPTGPIKSCCTATYMPC